MPTKGRKYKGRVRMQKQIAGIKNKPQGKKR